MLDLNFIGIRVVTQSKIEWNEGHAFDKVCSTPFNYTAYENLKSFIKRLFN